MDLVTTERDELDEYNFWAADSTLYPARAASLGLETVVPDSHTIALDIEGSHLPTRYWEMLNTLKRFYVVLHEEVKPSTGCIHVYLTMDKAFTVTERIALQAILGSCPRTELLSLIRAREGNLGEPILMFEKPELEPFSEHDSRPLPELR